MYRTLQIALLATLAALIGLAVWGSFGMAHHAIVAIDKWGEAGAQINTALERVNDPKRGTIKMLNETIGATKTAVIRADLVFRHEQQQLTTWDERGLVLYQNINGAITDARGAIKATTATANAATGLANEASKTLNQTTADLRTANDRLEQLRDTLTGINAGVTEARQALPDIRRGIIAGASTAEHVEGISSDAQHALHPILNPDPCTTRACKFKRGLGTFKSAGGFAEALYYILQVAQAL